MRIILVGSVSTVKRLRVSLGTLVAIEATASAEALAVRDAAATEAVERAFEAVERVNRLMHPRAEGSHLARINGAPLHVPVEIHRSVGQLLNLAKRINR